MKRTLLLVGKETEIIEGTNKGEISHTLQILVKRNKITDKHDYLKLVDNLIEKGATLDGQETYAIDLQPLFYKVPRKDGKYLTVENHEVDDLTTDYDVDYRHKEKVLMVNFNNIPYYYEQTNEKGERLKSTKFGYFYTFDDTGNNEYYVLNVTIKSAKYGVKNKKRQALFPIITTELVFGGEDKRGLESLERVQRLEESEILVGLSQNKEAHKTIFKDVIKLMNVRKDYIQKNS